MGSSSGGDRPSRADVPDLAEMGWCVEALGRVLAEASEHTGPEGLEAVARVVEQSLPEGLSVSIAVEPTWQADDGGADGETPSMAEAVRVDGSKLGQVTLRSSGPCEPGSLEGYRPFLSGVSSAVSMMISRDRRSERLRHVGEVLRSTREMHRLFGGEGDRWGLLSSICRALGRTRDYRTVLLVLLDDEGQMVELHHWGLSDRAVAELRAMGRRGEVPACVRCASEPGEALRAGDRLSLCEGCRLWGVDHGQRTLAAPIRCNGLVVGVLAIGLDEALAEDRDEMLLIEETASDVSRALEELELAGERDRLRTSLELANEIVEDSPAVLFRWRPREGWPVEYVSENVRRWGYEPEDFLTGRVPYSSIIHGQDLARVRREVSGHTESGATVFWQSYRIFDRNGDVRYVDDRTRAVRDDRGEVVCYQGLVLDVTERRLAEMEILEQRRTLRRSEERYRTVTEHFPAGAVFLYDRDLRYVFADGKALADVGLPPGALTGRRVEDVFPPHVAEVAEGPLRDALAGHTRRYEVTFRGRVYENLAAPVVSETGEIREAIVIAQEITDRKEAERAVRERTEELDRFFNASIDLLAIANVQGRFERLNREWERVLGYSRSELMDGEFMDFVHPDDRDATREALACLADQREVASFVNRYRRKDGTYRWLEWRSYPYGEKIYAAARDITERIERESQLRLQAMVLEQIQDVVTVTDLDGNITYTNDASCRMLGRPREEIVGRHLSSLGEDPSQGATQEDILSRTLAEGHWRGEVVNVGADGAIVRLDCRTRVVRDETGEPVALCGISTDVTEQRRIEEEVRQSEQRLRITLDSIGDGVIATDTQGRIVRMNRVAEALTGWSPAQAAGRSLSEVFRIVNAQTRRSVEDPVRRVLQTGEVVGLANDTLLIARDGRERQIADSGAPIRGGDGTIRGVVLVFRDVTEKHQMEERLRQGQKMEAIGQLAGGVAHDFNNQLATIMGFADILQRELEDADLVEYARNIVLAARRSADLTQQLLAFARRGQYHEGTVDLHALIREVAGVIGRSMDKRVEVAIEFAADRAVTRGDESQLQNALLNLALNARDAMPDGGTLTFATRNCSGPEDAPAPESPAPTQIEVSVRDTGVGIAEAHLDRIFEPFFTTKEKGRGTGMGLAAVYGTVRRNGGQVLVDSRVGEGTTFRLYLPVCESSASASEATETTRQAVRPCRILLVDDEASVGRMAERMLSEVGHRVTTFVSPGEAVAHFRENHEQIDLVILDMIMPGMSGEEVFRELREIDPEARVLVSSGYSVDDGARQLLRQGARAFLAKPYQRTELLETIQAACEDA